MGFGHQVLGFGGFANRDSGVYGINQSIRFNDNDSPNLSRTPTIIGNQNAFTISLWFKRGNIGSLQTLFNAGASEDLAINADNDLICNFGGSNYITNRKFRDPAAWMHLVVAVDTFVATASQRVRFYINGREETSSSSGATAVAGFSTETNPDRYSYMAMNTRVAHFIGSNEGGAEEWDGYITEFHFVDGAQLLPASFGKLDDNGIWIPIQYDDTTTVIAPIGPYLGELNGDMTEGGGLAFAFNEVFAATGASARSAGAAAATGFIGKDFGSGNEKVIRGADIFSPTNVGFDSNYDASVTISVWGSNTADPDYDSDTNWTQLSTSTFDTAQSGSTPDQSLQRFSQTTAYRHVKVKGVTSDTGDAGNTFSVSKVTFYEAVSGHGINGFLINASSTNQIGADLQTTLGTVAIDLVHSPAIQGDNATAFTFSSVALGAVAVDRKIAIFAGGQGGGTDRVISSITVAGRSAFLAKAERNNETNAELWVADVTEGTSATVVVTFSGSKGNCGIDVYRITGSSGAILDAGGSTADVGTYDIDVRPGGGVIGGWYVNKSSASAMTTTWAGTLTERTDRNSAVADEGTLISSATGVFADQQNNITVSATLSASAGYEATVFVSFAPTSTNPYIPTNLATTDVLPDSCVDDIDNGIGNYCTLNSISPTGAVTSDGNLVVLLRGNAGYDGIGGTQSFPRSGKWYFEVTFTTANSTNSNLIGIADGSTIKNDASGIDAGVKNRVYRSNDGQKQSNLASASSYGDAYGAGEVVGVAVDMDNGAMYFRNEGTFQNSGDPESGASKTGAAFTDLLSAGPYDWTPFIHNDGTSNNTFTANFGQFDFAATIPTGYSTLMTANYPEPAIPDGSVYFQATLYTGNNTAIGSGGKAVVQSESLFATGRKSTFQPDWIWVKNRHTTDGHVLVDSVRGVTNYLASDTNAVEIDNNESIVTFNSDGFTVGNLNNVNGDTDALVAWQWLADNTSGSTNDDGSIQTTLATNVRAGFTIGTYTGTGSAATLGHGLAEAPTWILVKERTNDVGSWHVYHGSNTAAPETDYLVLNDTPATADDATVFNDTAPTASVFSIGTADDVNEDSGTYVFYAFHDVIGYSKFGIYTGQGSATLNAFINTGFKPAFIIIKATSRTGTWNMYDTNRGGSAATDASGIGNITTLHVAADQLAKETNDYNIDILSNGFKIYDSQHYVGENAATYIYMAWAENPFGGSGVGQARAI
jgi:hypothetical protein